MTDRVQHPTQMIQLDDLGMHWLHQCEVCRWQQLICEHLENGTDAVRNAQGHPALRDAGPNPRIIAVFDRPAEDQASYTENPPEL